MHHLAQYLGRPWKDDSNCWEFVREVCKAEKGEDLPDHPAEALKAIGTGWTLLETPEHLCVVAMKLNSSSFRHAGIYLDMDGGVVLHCMKPQSVITPLSRLKMHGISEYKFFRYENSVRLQ